MNFHGLLPQEAVEISAGLLITNPKELGRIIPIRVSHPTVEDVGAVERRWMKGSGEIYRFL